MTSSGRNWTVRLLLVAAVVAAYFVGTLRPTPQIHIGEAHSAEGAITLEADGWSYGVPVGGVAWIDAFGSWHEDGRPDCLPPTGTTEAVTFAAVEVTIDGTTWRPVLWVDCRRQG